MLITSESKYVIVRILSNLTMLIVQNYSICIELYDQNKIPYYSIIENEKKWILRTVTEIPTYTAAPLLPYGIFCQLSQSVTSSTEL